MYLSYIIFPHIHQEDLSSPSTSPLESEAESDEDDRSIELLSEDEYSAPTVQFQTTSKRKKKSEAESTSSSPTEMSAKSKRAESKDSSSSSPKEMSAKSKRAESKDSRSSSLTGAPAKRMIQKADSRSSTMALTETAPSELSLKQNKDQSDSSTGLLNEFKFPISEVIKRCVQEGQPLIPEGERKQLIRDCVSCLRAVCGEHITKDQFTLASKMICKKVPCLKDQQPPNWSLNSTNFPYWVSYIYKYILLYSVNEIPYSMVMN